jgi:predicted permease
MNGVRAWLDDLRLTVRHARHARGFYTGVVLLLAIGMAGATVMFALIRGIVLRPLPLPREDRLVVSWLMPQTGLATRLPYRADDVDEIARASQSFTYVAGSGYNGAVEDTWADGSRSFTARTVVVMGGFFDTAGVQPRLGRSLTLVDDQSGAERKVVLSHGLWRRAFGGSPDVIGRTILLRQHAFTVTGVMPPDFAYPSGAELWVTRHALAQIERNEAFRTGLLRDVEILARLREGVTLDQAREELTALATRLDRERTGQSAQSFRPVVLAFKTAVIGDVGNALFVLACAVGCLLAIAIANVTNLFLLRGEHRRREFAVRRALGASQARLIAALLGESLLVALMASVAGLALARWALPLIVQLVPDGLPRGESIYIDGVVIGFAAAVAMVAAIVAAIVPGLIATRADVATGLSESRRGVAGSGSARGRRVLVAAQVALAVTVVAAAGLLTRSILRLQTVDMGLRADGLVLAELELPALEYADQSRRRSFFDTVSAQLRAAPGIEAVSPINTLPFAGAAGWDVPVFTGEGQSDADVAANPPLNFEVVTPEYFATLGVDMVRGRGFTEADRAGTLPVAIVSDAVAARVWPHDDAVGRRLKFGRTDSKRPWLTVVGVATTTRYRELATPRPTIYLPADQFMFVFGRLAIRSHLDPAVIARLVRSAVAAADSSVVVERVAPYAHYLRGPLAWPRFYALLLGVFALTALALTATGLYAVLSASIRQRHREMGVRMAVGATPHDVRRLVLREAFTLALAGVLLGLGLALATTRLLRHLLYDTSPLDPISLVTASLLLVLVTLAASWLPARRATRVDPMVILRGE